MVNSVNITGRLNRSVRILVYSRFGLVWFGLVWFGLVWFGLVRFGSVRFGSVRFGSVQLGLVCSPMFDSIRFGPSVSFDLVRLFGLNFKLAECGSRLVAYNEQLYRWND